MKNFNLNRGAKYKRMLRSGSHAKKYYYCHYVGHLVKQEIQWIYIMGSVAYVSYYLEKLTLKMLVIFESCSWHGRSTMQFTMQWWDGKLLEFVFNWYNGEPWILWIDNCLILLYVLFSLVSNYQKSLANNLDGS